MSDAAQEDSADVTPALRARVTSRLAHSSLASIAALVLPCLAAPLLTMVFALAPNAGGAVMALCLAAWLFAVVALAWPTTVTLGADGALLEWLATKRWVRWSDVTDVRKPRWSFAIELATRDGRTLTIPTRKAYGVDAADINLTQPLIQRITHEMARAKPHGRGVEHLGRGEGRSVEAWVQSLRDVGRGATGHMRQTAVSRESLRDTMEDTSLAESIRAAAAVALAALGARDDVKVRVETIASPKLRAVMSAATEDDDARLVDAMREIDAQEKKR